METAASRINKVERVLGVKTQIAATLGSQKPYQKPAQDGPISNSSSYKAMSKRQVWDCGSSLYDSFELNSFNRQLDSAIKASSRALSMPHLPERRCFAPEPLQSSTITKHQITLPNKSTKLSKSLKKILQSVFGSSNKSTNHLSFKHKSSEMYKDNFSFNNNGSKSMRALSTIPEMQDLDGLAIFSPVATPVVRRAASERFT